MDPRLSLLDFNGSVKRNRNEEAMMRSLTSREEFLQKLESERTRRKTDIRKNESAYKVQRWWKKCLARKVVADKAREAFDRNQDKMGSTSTNEETTRIISEQIGRLNLCYQSPQDDDRLLSICGSCLKLLSGKRLDVLPPRSWRNLGRLIVVFLRKANPHANLAAPLRVFEAIMSVENVEGLITKENYFVSMIRHISYFVPTTSTFIMEEPFPPRVETLCAYLLAPITKVREISRPKLVANLLESACEFTPLLPVIAVIVPFLRRAQRENSLRIEDILAADDKLKPLAENDRKDVLTYFYITFLQHVITEESPLPLRLSFLKLVAERLDGEIEEKKASETNLMDTDNINDGQVLFFVRGAIRQTASGSGWVEACMNESQHDGIEYMSRITNYLSSNETLHLLAAQPKFLQRLWFHLDQAGARDKQGFQRHIESLKNGTQLSVEAQRSFLPVLSLFVRLLAIWIRGTSDDCFIEGHPAMPFSRADLVKMAETLRDVVLSLINLAFPDDLQLNERNKTKEGKQELQRWSSIYENMVTLLRLLQQKDQRVHFLPEGLWNDHKRLVVIPRNSMELVPNSRHWRLGVQQVAGSAFGFVRHLFNTDGDTSDEEEEDTTSQPRMTSTDLRNLNIMRSIPFVVPFKQRLKMFDEIIRNDKERRGVALDNWGHPGNSINISVRRDQIYSDSFEALSLVKVPDLRLPMRVHMINWAGLHEAGIDGGGIFREYLAELIRTAFDPEKGFFQYTSDRLLYPNPLASKLYDNYSQHFYFLGRIIAKLIYEKQLAEIRFADFFLIQLLGADRAKNVDLHHMKSFDPDVWKHLIKLKEYTDEELAELYLDFTVLQEELGVSKRVELIPGGADVRVNRSNRDQYIQLYTNYFLYKRMEPIVDSMRAGVTNVLDVQILAIFSASELQLLVSGADVDIDVTDMRMYSTVHHGNTAAEESYIESFWEFLRSMESAEKRALLKFITGCSRPPLEGFRNLYPQIGIQLTNATGLPTSATCMNLLKLPVYKTIDELKEKIRYAINSGAGFELS